ncbi:MAG TPA: glycosyltransferase, partial [Armatimonadota bacterium]|nr:glycosyltransferase [Armatimonadota bacterium]
NGVDAEGRFNPDALDPATRATLRERHGIPLDATAIGFVGRVVRDKGLIELAGAWTTLREQFPALRLLICGRIEPQDPLPPAVLAMLQDDPRVHLIGEVTDVPGYLMAMDILCLPTYREGFPNVPLEAAAMRLPVVATRIPGCVDAVAEGDTGLLVPPYDAEALAEALGRYLADPALRQAHGLAGYARVRRDFRPQAIWEAIYGEYRALLAARGITACVPDMR